MNEFAIQWVDFFIGLTVLFVYVDVALLFLQFCVQLYRVVLLFNYFVFLTDLVLQVGYFLTFIHLNLGS